MTYGYLRVSTDQQDENNQKVGVDEKAKRMGLVIDEYIIDHGVSGTKEPEKRQLGKLMDKLKDGDLIIASELSRFGRSMYMVMRILEFFMKNGVKVVTVKDNYELGDNIQSKVLAFAFSLAAEIERDLISRRTREALARCKVNGKKLGRRPGPNKTHKLDGQEEYIHESLKNRVSKKEIGDRLGVCGKTVSRFVRDKNIPDNYGSPRIKRVIKPRVSRVEKHYEKIKILIEAGITYEKISEAVGFSRAAITKFCQKHGIEKGGAV